MDEVRAGAGDRAGMCRPGAGGRWQDLLRIASGLCHFLWNLSKQLNALREVVLVPFVPFAGSRVKKEVPRQKLENYARERPHIRAGGVMIKGACEQGVGIHLAGPTADRLVVLPRVVFGANDDFRTAVLAGLDVVREVLVRPARVAKVDNHDARLLEHRLIRQNPGRR